AIGVVTIGIGIAIDADRGNILLYDSLGTGGTARWYIFYQDTIITGCQICYLSRIRCGYIGRYSNYRRWRNNCARSYIYYRNSQLSTSIIAHLIIKYSISVYITGS